MVFLTRSNVWVWTLPKIDPLLSTFKQAQNLNEEIKKQITTFVTNARGTTNQHPLKTLLNRHGELFNNRDFMSTAVATHIARALSVHYDQRGLFIPRIRNSADGKCQTIQFWKLKQDQAQRFVSSNEVLEQDNYTPLFWQQVLVYWKSGRRSKEARAFCNVFMQCLAGFPTDFFFWKTNPFSKSTQTTTIFEMKLITGTAMRGKRSSVFDERFGVKNDSSKNQDKHSKYFYVYKQESAVFQSLSECPMASPSPVSSTPDLKEPFLDCTHLASFTRNAPLAQQHDLWEKFGSDVLTRGAFWNQKFGDREKSFCWLSTSGKGQNWLHLRVDPRAKYYDTAYGEEYHQGGYVPTPTW